ncbi:hypothetical protein LTR36_002575 [Oleoguttula mirabilis]|uniref:Uncharacterized protein n=1 Tax=Oleoguttula mirabilis TaxID=1507867 RepID=A0AAV9JKV6_9PEZI|nr:hypothetical protein LTR36_002575 [Oleoguttula mirabilis]
MGIPYSKEINAAFDEVSPLVSATLDIVQTTKNISYLLAGIQVITAILQFATVLCLIGLLITLNPDLVKERTALITPALQYMASWVMPGSEGRWYFKVFGWMLAAAWMGGCAVLAWQSYLGEGGGGDGGPPREVPLPDDEDEGGDEEGGPGGKDDSASAEQK